MKKVSKQLSSLSLIAAAVVLFGGCSQQTPTTTAAGGSASSPVANTQDLKNVRVQLSFLKQSLDAPLILAMKNGYFAKEGLNVTYERGFGNADTISKLGTGKFDLSFSDMYNALEFNEKNPNDKIMAVAVTQNRAPFAILALKDKGIASPKDLTAKKLGAPAGDGPRKLFPVFAKQVGIDPNSVEWTTMEPRLRESFLLQGQVDAISGFATSALPGLLKGGKKLDDINVFYYNDNGLEFYGNTILAKASFVEQNPDTIKAFVRAYMRGLQDTLRDPSAALDAVMASDDSKLMDREAERVRLQVALDRMLLSPEVEQNGLGAADPARLEKTLKQTAEGFGLKTTPAVADIFTDKFLPPKEQRTVPTDRKPLT
ncbi:ABC transporter substrate-binding protein [Cyanobacteria bacterium FACHB-DQ100]|uniref:ABC transporter substrate-binding protein n=1 Tax=Leptolyngbya sp. DQ-M1 TaxID=2933920 RepID=UPI0019BB3F2F|nr:ABC transporter substrate-binding protein [Cyanobacteria bacterium FACHB-DQ100]